MKKIILALLLGFITSAVSAQHHYEIDLNKIDKDILPVKMTSLSSRDIKLSGTPEFELFCENTGLIIKRKPKKVRHLSVVVFFIPKNNKIDKW